MSTEQEKTSSLLTKQGRIDALVAAAEGLFAYLGIPGPEGDFPAVLRLVEVLEEIRVAQLEDWERGL